MLIKVAKIKDPCTNLVGPLQYKNTYHEVKSCTPLIANGGIESSTILEVRVKLC